MLTINIGGREILGAPREGAITEGLIVKPGGFQGWQGIASTRREALARAVEHGEHDTPVYLGSRVVTIDGWVLASSEQDLSFLSDSLTGLLAAGRTRVTIEHQGDSRWADGRVVLAECDDSGARGRLLHSEFQLQMVFADPRRYGETIVHPTTGTATSISVAHRGNFPAYPVIEIPAAPAAYSISSPAGTFTVAGATSGGTHTVDLRRGRVFRNGVEMPDVGHGDLWTVPPGRAMTHVLSAPGRVRILNTYV